MVENIKNAVALEISSDPASWIMDDTRSSFLLVAINTPRYNSLAIRLLALWLQQHADLAKRFDIRFVEFGRDQSLAEIVGAITVWKPDLIGLSMNIWNQQNSIDLALSIKEVSPGTQIIVGGQEVTNSFTNYLQEVPAIDYLIDGEGEIPLRQFLSNWTRQRGLDDCNHISGLWYRSDGRVKFTRPAGLVESLDDIPSVVLADLVPANPENVLGVMLEGTRGCPFRCAFCFEGFKKCKVRSASVERLIEEMAYMAGRGARFFHILDPIFFNSDIERMELLGTALAEIREKHQCSISIEAYADQINEKNIEYYRLFSVLDLGLQSINPETLKAIHRRYSPEKFDKGLSLLRSTKATTNIYLISGLPFETAVTFLRGIQFVFDKKPSRIFCNELLLLNGTELREKAVEYGYVFNPVAPYNVYSNKWISTEELLSIQLASTTVSTRYNLASRKSYAEVPGYVELDELTDAYFPYSAGCSHGCSGCRNRASESFAQQKTDITSLLEKELNRLDIYCGNMIHRDEFFQLLAHTHLAEVNYMQLVIPCDGPIDMDVLCTLFRYNVLHYKVYLPVDKNVQGLSDESKRTLSCLTSVIKYGDHRMKPFLEVVLFAEDSSPERYISMLKAVTEYTPHIISVVDNTMVFDRQWHKFLVDYFVVAREKQVWLKLPMEIFEEVFSQSSEKKQILAELDKLDLVSTTASVPPCFAPI